MEVPTVIPTDAITAAAKLALEEDAPWGDLTSEALPIGDVKIWAEFVLRTDATIAGLPVVQEVFRLLGPDCEVQLMAQDGDLVRSGQSVATVTALAPKLLRGERIALNFLQRMSGVATITRQFAQAIAGTKAKLVDTRKTTPGLRALEKYAVRCGGGINHRYSLSDGVLIKDNHLAALKQRGVDITQALRDMKERIPFTTHIEVEVDELAQIPPILDSKVVDSILIDNFDIPSTRKAVEMVAGRAMVNASGGINLSTIRSVAECGVDLISVGALTHSAPAIDIGLDVDI
jgi:nicotinate-nucleotide pyrophosphorylase (carboxylating)